MDIVLALDVSHSMKAEDFPGNRLEEARRTIKRFVSGRPDDRIGLVLFAGLAVTRAPLTLDHAMLLQFLDEVDFAPREQDGTALGMGLASAVNRLRRSDARSRVVVLLTDGKSGEVPLMFAGLLTSLRRASISLTTVGVGAEVDRPLLESLAKETGGRFLWTDDPRTVVPAGRMPVRAWRRAAVWATESIAMPRSRAMREA